MKKLNKFFAVLVALAMMAMLSVTAFATNKGEEASAAESSKDAVITKVLQVAEGVTAPTATFNFNIAASDETSYTVTKVTQEEGQEPVSEQVTVTGHSKTDAATKIKGTGDFTIATADMSNAKDSQSSKVGFKAIAGLLEFAPGDGGVYTYVITEKAHSDFTDTANEKITDNVGNKSYTIRVYVKDGQIDKITVTDPDNKKVEATNTTASNVDPYNPSGAYFVNKYEKQITPPSPDTNNEGALNIKKEIPDGTSGDKNQAWPFTITLTQAETDKATNTSGKVTAKILKADGTVKTASVDIFYGNPTGTQNQFDLAHGEKLVFDQLPAGTKYTVKERLTDATATNKGSYTATANVGIVGTATKGADLTTAEGTLTENKSNVTVTNTIDESDVTPTGILISNLPYIALALVAIGGLVAYVVVRRRQSDEA